MWSDYVTATGAIGTYTAEAFAEELPEVATQLALLVRDGPKRATTSAMATKIPRASIRSNTTPTSGSPPPAPT